MRLHVESWMGGRRDGGMGGSAGRMEPVGISG